MFKGYRIIAAALGLAFIASVSAGIWAIWSLEEYYAYERQDIAERQNSEAHSGIEACREIPYVFSPSKCISDAIAAAKEESASYKDLKAQQHMSLSALGVLIVSTITMLVTAVGVVFVYYTLRETKRTVDVTREIGEAQTTSYLIMDHVVTRPHDKAILVHYSVRNIGSTPSHQTEMSIKIRPHNVSYPRGVNPFSKAEKINLESIAAGATSESFTMFVDIKDPDFFSAWPPRGSVEFSAEIELIWTDVFQKRHYGWFLMGRPDPEFQDSKDIRGSEYDRKMLTSRSRFSKLMPQKNHAQ